MTETPDLVAFLKAQFDEDEAAALAAQRADAPASGEHWQWEYTGGLHGRPADGITDTVVDLDACAGLESVTEAGNGSPVSLRSAEEYPFKAIAGSGPHIVLGSVDELNPGVARHIARHDPARVLREVEAKRRLIERVLLYEAKIDGEWGCCHDPQEIAAGECDERPPAAIEALRLLALPYSDRPGYNPEWSV